MDVKLMRPIDPEQYIERIPEAGCWIWTKSMSHDGYGVKGKTYVHRLMYEKAYGKIPDGLTLDHVCRVRSCCNPAHMRPMTLKENIALGNYGWRAQLTHCAKGHEFTPENTYFRHAGGRNKTGSRTCRECGRQAVSKYLAKKKDLIKCL